MVGRHTQAPPAATAQHRARQEHLLLSNKQWKRSQAPVRSLPVPAFRRCRYQTDQPLRFVERQEKRRTITRCEHRSTFTEEMWGEGNTIDTLLIALTVRLDKKATMLQDSCSANWAHGKHVPVGSGARRTPYALAAAKRLPRGRSPSNEPEQSNLCRCRHPTSPKASTKMASRLLPSNTTAGPGFNELASSCSISS